MHNHEMYLSTMSKLIMTKNLMDQIKEQLIEVLFEISIIIKFISDLFNISSLLIFPV